jgi:hypothetical protein
VFSQLSGHDSRDVAFLVCPRLFNDGERVGDAPQPLEGLRAENGDTARIRCDRHDDVLLDLDVNGPAPCPVSLDRAASSNPERLLQEAPSLLASKPNRYRAMLARAYARGADRATSDSRCRFREGLLERRDHVVRDRCASRERRATNQDPTSTDSNEVVLRCEANGGTPRAYRKRAYRAALENVNPR